MQPFAGHGVLFSVYLVFCPWEGVEALFQAQSFTQYSMVEMFLAGLLEDSALQFPQHQLPYSYFGTRIHYSNSYTDGIIPNDDDTLSITTTSSLVLTALVGLVERQYPPIKVTITVQHNTITTIN